MITENRFWNEEKESILSMIEQELPHGSGFDAEWDLRLTTPTRVNAFGSYHCMNDGGYYDGWVDFTVHFDLADDDVFKVTFRSWSQNRWRAKKYFLREYIEEMTAESLTNAIWGNETMNIRKKYLEKLKATSCPVCGLTEDCVNHKN